MAWWRCCLCSEGRRTRTEAQARTDSHQHYLDHHYQHPDPPKEDE